MSYVPDTNIVIAAFNGHELVLNRLDTLAPTEILLCSPVLAELEFGARCSRRRDENLERIDRLIVRTCFVPFDLVAARRFGDLKARFRRQGITKTDFDLAIASIAMAQEAILVSDDHAFFDQPIPGLQVENWLR